MELDDFDPDEDIELIDVGPKENKDPNKKRSREEEEEEKKTKKKFKKESCKRTKKFNINFNF